MVEGWVTGVTRVRVGAAVMLATTSHTVLKPRNSFAFSPPTTLLYAAMSGTDLRSKSTSPLHSGQYVPKDVYAQYNLTPKRSSLQESGTHLASLYPLGMIRFEQEKYEEFVKVRTCGREGWQLSKQEVRL